VSLNNAANAHRRSSRDLELDAVAHGASLRANLRAVVARVDVDEPKNVVSFRLVDLAACVETPVAKPPSAGQPMTSKRRPSRMPARYSSWKACTESAVAKGAPSSPSRYRSQSAGRPVSRR